MKINDKEILTALKGLGDVLEEINQYHNPGQGPDLAEAHVSSHADESRPIIEYWVSATGELARNVDYALGPTTIHPVTLENINLHISGLKARYKQHLKN